MPAPALIPIAAPGLSAEIDPVGAELHALRDADGRDLLWDGDPAVWAGRAPVLFPIVGALAGGEYRWRGRTYALPRHGFARRRRFELVERSADAALLRLAWDEDTFAVYPFRFALDIGFSLAGATLTMTASVRNLDLDAVMPASFGFHPAFRWPLPYGAPRAQHRLRFERAEPASIRRIDVEGLVRPDLLPTPVAGHDLILDDALFADDAVIFDRLESRRLRYGAETGPWLDIAFADTPWLGVWSKPGAGYVCIEPWQGVADPQGFAGDLTAKPGIVIVEPRRMHAVNMSVSLSGQAGSAA
jgi:galactose mutarotase-like enzyme